MAGQLRVRPDGVATGLDAGAVLAVAGALGLEARAVATLLPAAEAGLLAGLAQRRPHLPVGCEQEEHPHGR